MAVGVAVGTGVGVGVAVGSGVGMAVGSGVGMAVGSGVGIAVGSGVGMAVGSGVGEAVGSGVGIAVGSGVGIAVGSSVCVGFGVGLGSSEHPASSMNTEVMLMTRPPIINLDIATSLGTVQTPPSKETSGIYDFLTCTQVWRRPVNPLVL